MKMKMKVMVKVKMMVKGKVMVKVLTVDILDRGP